MPYSEPLADRLRDALHRRPDVRDHLREKRMFGGIAFLVHGNMAVGVIREDVTARVGPDAYDACLRLPGARPMDFTGRPMKGWLFVAEDALASDDDVDAWVDRCLAFVRTLPPK